MWKCMRRRYRGENEVNAKVFCGRKHNPTNQTELFYVMGRKCTFYNPVILFPIPLVTYLLLAVPAVVPAVYLYLYSFPTLFSIIALIYTSVAGAVILVYGR
jgi:hypothetical protein